MLPRSSLYTSADKLENTVISAWMPISRPWTVTIRQCKRLIQATCQPAVSRPWIKGICCASVLPSLDAGFRHPCRKDGPPTLVYNDERSRVGMQTLPLLRFDISDAGASPEAFPRRAWERYKDFLKPCLSSGLSWF